ncbi:MAG: hypothetical protein ACKO0Z_22590 [Betaproteobacteria bacterium]
MTLATTLILAGTQAWAAPGNLDTSFGKANDGTPDGVVNLSFGNGNEGANAAVLQKDGKLVVAGYSSSTGGKSSNIIILRLNKDGSLDPSFGVGQEDNSPDGVVSIDLGDSADVAAAIALQTDGKILIAGNRRSKTSDIVLARLMPNGKLDSTFGKGDADGTPDGVVSISLSDGDDVANALAVQKDGKIVVAGTTVATDKTTNIAVARLKADGTLDTTFGKGDSDGTPDGVVSVSLSEGSDTANALALQTDGKIVVAGTATAKDKSTNIAVARLKADGTLDPTFGVGTSDGTPDGVVAVSLSQGNDAAKAVAIHRSQIYVAGEYVAADGSTNVAVARLKSDGSLDPAFGRDASDNTPDGVSGVSFGNGNDHVHALAIQSDGALLVLAGTTSAADKSANIAVARMKSDGTLDKRFGAGESDGTPEGVVGLSLGAGDDVAKAVVLQSDGKIVVVGDRVNGSSSDIVVVRILGK